MACRGSLSGQLELTLGLSALLVDVNLPLSVHSCQELKL